MTRQAEGTVNGPQVQAQKRPQAVVVGKTGFRTCCRERLQREPAGRSWNVLGVPCETSQPCRGELVSAPKISDERGCGIRDGAFQNRYISRRQHRLWLVGRLRRGVCTSALGTNVETAFAWMVSPLLLQHRCCRTAKGAGAGANRRHFGDATAFAVRLMFWAS